MYGMKHLTSVNEARFEMFLKKYKPKNEEQELCKVKRLDGSSMPPCQRVLREKIKRTQCIAHQWRSATAQTPSQAHVPESSGWILEDAQYKLVWFTGEVAPKVIDVTTVDKEIEEAEVDINEDEGFYYIF